MPAQLGSRYRFRIITESGGVNASGTVTDPCPTLGGVLGGINYCNLDDYKDWLRSADLQNSEIQRKKNEIEARGFTMTPLAESYGSRYLEAYDDRESWILNPLDTRQEVLKVIDVMEIGAAYEHALADVLEQNGVDADTFNAIEKKDPIGSFSLGVGTGTIVAIAALGLGYAYISGRIGRR